MPDPADDASLWRHRAQLLPTLNRPSSPTRRAHGHRDLRRQLRSRHARSRGPHVAQPHLRGRLVVAVAINSAKQPLFSVTERVEMIRASIGERSAHRGARLRRAARGLRESRGRHALHSRTARRGGLRVRVSDGAHEPPSQQRSRDRVHGAGIDRTYMSSSVVREVARYGGNTSGLVHPVVERRSGSAFWPPAARRRDSRPRPRGGRRFAM